MDALNERGLSLKGSKVLVLGIAYKKDVDDLRESPSLDLIRLLREKGAKVDYNDPYLPIAVSHKRGFKMKSTPLSATTLRKYDCILIATDHTCYDYAWIAKMSPLVVDTRNATKGIRGANIVKA